VGVQADRHRAAARILIWQGSDRVILRYRDPEEAAAGYDVADQKAALAAMAELLGQLVATVSGP
jgi:uncharacterized protein (DUF302 family)